MSEAISKASVCEILADIYPTDGEKVVAVKKIDKAYEAIQQLPFSQPEVIQCKDCRWWDKDEDSPYGYCMAMKHGYMSANWEIGIYRKYKGDFYCADAEWEGTTK